MGNRAFITDRKKEMGIYLHWNGGRDSVEAFLKYCELKGYRYPETDGYGWARLAQVIGNFFGGGLSIGIEPRVYDPGDNGIYVIEKWKIVDRIGSGREQNEYDLDEMLIEIDDSQPEHERLGRAFLMGWDVPTEELEIGDVVYIESYDGFEKYPVCGFGDDRKLWVDRSAKGVPMINRYPSNEYSAFEDNPNNYLLNKTYRKANKDFLETRSKYDTIALFEKYAYDYRVKASRTDNEIEKAEALSKADAYENAAFEMKANME